MNLHEWTELESEVLWMEYYIEVSTGMKPLDYINTQLTWVDNQPNTHNKE